MLKYLLLLLLLLLIYRYIRYVSRKLSKSRQDASQGRTRKGGVDIRADQDFISEMENSKKFNEGEYIDFEEIKENKQQKPEK